MAGPVRSRRARCAAPTAGGARCPEPVLPGVSHGGSRRMKSTLAASRRRIPSSWVRSFLDRAADGPQVLTEGQVRIPLSVLEERRELDLLPKGVPAPDSLSLPPLGVTDAFGNVENLDNTVIGKEYGSIVVCEDNVAGADRVLADAGRHERLRILRHQIQRSGRDRAQAEHWH